jgi:YkoY family integral membrane protein
MLEAIMPLFSVSGLMAVLYLIILEGVLSVDNALALAALVKSRLTDPAEQAKALHYGIVGAYVFRILVIFIGVWLMSHEWVKWMAAIYLIYLGVSELFLKKHAAEDGENEVAGMNFKFLSPLWSTIIAVELMDIMFSIDSIAVALSVSDKTSVLIAGAILGIVAMRFAAKYFIKLIDKFPVLEKTAFVLVALAGFKIVIELLGVHVSEMVFMPLMFAVIGGSMLLNKLKPELFHKA